MDPLYTLCRSADNRHAPPLSAAAAAEVIAAKKAYFAAEAEKNPLVRAILAGGEVTFEACAGCRRPTGFLAGPATFFRTHELLRKTRRGDTPLRIDGVEYTHDAVAEMFARCVPNARLEHVPWYSPSRYTSSLAFAWTLTLVTAHLVARDAEDGHLFDSSVITYLGVPLTGAALVQSALRQNRDVRRAAPWNSALYLDLNADLLRRDSPALAVARKEQLPRQRPIKTERFYYAVARRIAAHDFDELLERRRAFLREPAIDRSA
ncbi:MAG TPA: hypothetical protein VGD81_11685 [Opitutaceae bacterium]